MAGEQYNVTKVIRNGDEYYFPGAGQVLSKKIFGTGCDGDCVIEYDDSIKGNTFLEAREYNFNNLTICSGVKLRFCGTGIPVIRVKENFNNYGTICLRNPLLNNDSQYAEPYSKMILCSCKNNSYSSALSIYNCLQIECLKSCAAVGGIGCTYGGSNRCMMSSAGGRGGTFYSPGTTCTSSAVCGCTAHSGAPGANTEYAGGGGGAGGEVSAYPGCAPTITTGSLGGNASGCNGGMGGSASSGYPGGGGGGFGMCNGGNGGCGFCGGNGGNAIYGNGGNGGASYSRPGHGGCAYYGNGGAGGNISATNSCCRAGNGGCSVFGSGGAGGNNSCSCARGAGGSSVFGSGGSSYTCGCCYCCWGCGITGQVAWGGIYDIGLYAKNLSNNGNILGNGDKGCVSGGVRGAKIHFVYSSFISNGTITCTGNGCPNGCIVTCQI